MKRILLATLLISLVGLLNITAQERIYSPELSLPLNDAINLMPDVVLDWNAVTGGNTGFIKYDIQLDTDPAFTNPVNVQTEFVTAYKTSMLLFGETYYWRVRAIDGTDVSDWSETWSFRVIRRIILYKPEDATEQKTDVKLIWNGISGISEYDYQIDTTYYWNAVNSGLSQALNGVTALDDNHVWIVGEDGVVLFFDGTSWTEQESDITKDLNSVHFLDTNNGWAAGNDGNITYYDGTEWAAQESGTTKDLNGIYMLDANNGWAVGEGGIIRYFNGSGWSTQYTAIKDLQEVFAVDANHVWAVGNGGFIFFYDGSSWASQESGTTKDITDVAFTTPDQGWAVGKSGTFLEFKSGTWEKLDPRPVTDDVYAICFTGPDNAWAVGKSGAVAQYDGIEWFSQSGGTENTLNAVGLAGSVGFFAGEDGTLISYNDDAFSSPLATIQHVPGDILTTNIHDLMFGTQYFWRMRAKHDLDLSSWSGARSFTTIAAVELDKPADNSIDMNLDVLLEWDKVSDMVSYEIQVDDDPAYGSPLFLATEATEINAELLKFGTVYNWRARALHAFDISDWSESWKFTTVNSVILESPADNATDVKLSPLLTWKALTGIADYQVQFADNNSFSNPIADAIVPVEENSFIVPLVLEKDADYYWRVRAVNGLDTSGWSSTWSFRTMPPVGIDEPGLSGKLNIYPNPAENTVYIQLKEKLTLSLRITITDLVGKKVFEKDILLNSGNKNIPVDISSLQNGIYMLRIADKENTYTKKLIVRR